MSVTVTNPVAGPFTPNGATVAFPFDFKIASASEIAVYQVNSGIASLIGSSDYSVSIASDGEGGTVTMDTAPATGSGSIYLVSDPSFQLAVSFAGSSRFSPASLNGPFDRLAVQDVSLNERVGRAFLVPVGEAGGTLPAAALRASKTYMFDDQGNPTVGQPTSSKGDPGSPGEGYATRAAMATAGNDATDLDDVFLTETPGRAGKFIFYTAAAFNSATGLTLTTMVSADTEEGIFIPRANDPTGAGGAWVRQFEGPLNPLWFGLTEGEASGANGAANSAALAGMFAAMETRAVNPIGDHRGLETIRFPAGYFEFDETIDITGGARIIEGQATGVPYARTTILKFPAGVTGIRVQAKDTSGAEDEDAVDHFSGGATVVRGLTLLGAFVDTEAEAHGIHLRSAAIVENCFIGEFEGDGIHCNASAAGVPLGNTNNSIVRDSRIEFCRNGLYVDGTDANIWLVSHVDTSLNRQWGIWERSFLGNTYIACHSASNGRPIGTAPGSTVSHGGNRYAVIVGEEAGASTNAPTGAATDNQWWHWLSVGGVNASNPAWVSGTTYRAGGVAATDSASGRNVFSGCYAETGQGMAQFVEPTLVIGGMLAHHMRAGSGYLTGTGGITVGGDKLSVINHIESRGINSSFGPISGAAADNLLYLEATNLSAGVNFRTWVAGVGTIVGYIKTAGSGGTAQLRINHSTTIVWRIADTAKGRITATELRAETDNAMDLGLTGTRWKTVFGYTGDFTTQVKVAGTKVLGAQGAAVADAAALTSVDGTNAVAAPTQAEFNALVAEFNKLRIDLAATRTTLNTLLARGRDHGLIAT